MPIPYRRHLILLLGCFLLAAMLAVSASHRSARAETSSAERIAKLVKQLGSDDYAERETASKALAALGEETRAALEKAAAAHTDAEVRQRARELVGKLDDAVYGEIRSFKGSTPMLSYGCVCFSPDGKRVLSSSMDGTIRLWEVATGKEIRRIKGETEVLCFALAFCPDGKQALSIDSDSQIRQWDLETGKEVRHIDTQKNVKKMTFAQTLVAGIRTKSGSFSPDRKQVLYVGDNQPIRLWDVETGKELRRFNSWGEVQECVCFGPDGKQALSRAEFVYLWEVATGKKLRSFKGDVDSSPECVCFSPDGKKILCGRSDNTLRLWDVETGKELCCFKGHDHPALSASFSSDGKKIVSVDRGLTMRLWDVSTGKELHRFPPGPYGDQTQTAVFTPDGKRILSASLDGTLHLWRAEPRGKYSDN